MIKKLIEKDLAHLWHPYTQMKDCEKFPPIPIKRAEGIKLYDYADNFYYDTISSWWCNVHGHNHPSIKKAIKDQLDALDHVLFAGFTHKPAIDLAEKLIKIMPEGLSRIFYSDNGSTAVEVALKMSFQFWLNSGKKNKTSFLSFDRGYHGDTVGAMSVSGVDAYNGIFKPLFFNSYKTPVPVYSDETSVEEKAEIERDCYLEMRNILEKHKDEIAAVIVEPLLLGAGGMLIYSSSFLKKIKDLTQEFGVHLILDEVASGFGRTGKMFACEHADVTPDFICISKGITSGCLSLSATITNDEIFKSFYDEYENNKTFFHGHTYTANPIACSAANASIDLFDKEDTLNNVLMLEKEIKKFLSNIKSLDIVSNTRCIGAVGAFDLKKELSIRSDIRNEKRIGYKIYQEGLKKNLLLRPLGDTIYFFLPLSTTSFELKDIFQRTFELLEEIS